MAEDKQELLDEYRRTREELLEAIEGLSDSVMSEESLDGWSVKDHLLHLALWDDVRAQEVARISAGLVSAWEMTDEQDADFNALSYQLRHSLSPSQARWELAASRERLLEAIAGATERGLDASLYGDAGLRSGHEAEHTRWIRRWRREQGL